MNNIVGGVQAYDDLYDHNHIHLQYHYSYHLYKFMQNLIIPKELENYSTDQMQGMMHTRLTVFVSTAKHNYLQC